MGRQSFVDDVRGHRRLRQPLALRAHPLAADVPLHREHARGVVELLGHVLADALQSTAAAAHGRGWLVANLAARQVRRQHLALRLLLACLRRRCAGGRLLALELAAERLEVFVDRFLQQALLLAAEPLALAAGVLQPLQHRHLVRQLLDERLLVPQLDDQLRSELAYLVVVNFVEIYVGRVHHGAHGAAVSLAWRSIVSAIARLPDLQHSDHPAIAERAPRQAKYQGVELLAVQCKPACSSTRPDETALVQPSHCQPHSEAVVHQHFDPIAAPVGEQVRMMWLCRTEHRDHARQRGVHADTQVQWLDREPHRVDTDHFSQSRSQAAHSAAADNGQLTVIAVTPRRISTRMSLPLSEGLLVVSATGTNSLRGAGAATGRHSRTTCRQRCTTLSLIPCDIATLATEAPGSSHSASTCTL